MVYKFGLMEQLIKESGTIIKVVVKANSLILMEIIIQANGKTIRLTDTVLIFIPEQVPNIKVIGKMICNMDQAPNNTVMVVNIRECLSKEKDMAMVLMFFRIKLFMMVSG